MIFIILIWLVVLGIAFMQSTQGFFSAIITTFVAMISTVVAFAYYEPFAAVMYEDMPAYADGVALLSIFIATGVVLKIVVDLAIPGDVSLGADVVSVWIGRGVAGVFGLISGMLLCGVLLVSMQLMPFGPSILGYAPYDGALKAGQSAVVDRFALGTAKMLSGGALSGERKFAESHPDLMLETFTTRNDAGLEGDGLAETPVKALEAAKFVKTITKVTSLQVKESPILEEMIDDGKVLTEISATVATTARDGDESWRLPGTQFELVSKSGKRYYPVAGRVQGVIFKGDNNDHPQKALRVKLNAAKQAEGGQAKWDLTKLAVVVGMPEKKKVTDPKGKTKEVDANSVVVVWTYVLEPNDEPDYMSFRRISKTSVVMPKKKKTD